MDDHQTLVVLASCLSWPIYVMILSRILKQSMAADLAATVLGLLVIVCAI